MADWKERVEVERRDLRDKLEKLYAFMRGPKWDEVSADERLRLERQADLMARYHDILCDRIIADFS